MATTTQSPNACGNLLSCTDYDSPRACFRFHISLSVGSTGMHFVLTRLSSLTSILPLSICLVWLDSCSLSVGKLHNCLSQGIAHSPFWFQSSLKLRLFLNSLPILPSDFKTPNQSIDLVQPRLTTFVWLLTMVDNQFRHVSHGELTLNLPRIVWDLF